MRAVSKHFALGHSRGQDRIKPYGRGVELICYVREIGRPNHVALETNERLLELDAHPPVPTQSQARRADFPR